MIYSTLKLQQQTLRLLSIIFLMLCFSSVIAATKQKIPDPKDLIGLEVVDGQYPYGWVWDGVRLGGVGSTFYVIELKNKKQYAFVFLMQKGDSESVKRISGTVTDAISVTKPNDEHQLARRCYFEHEAADVTAGTKTRWINANVRFKNYCDLETRQIKKAWKYDLTRGRFEIIGNTKGLICEFGSGADNYKKGVPDFRENCPSSNWYPTDNRSK